MVVGLGRAALVRAAERPAYNIRIDLSGTNTSKAKLVLRLGDAPDSHRLTEREKALRVFVDPTNDVPQEAVLKVAIFTYGFFKERGYGLGGRSIADKETSDRLTMEFNTNYFPRIGIKGVLTCPPGGGFARLSNFQFNPPAEVHITNLRAREAAVSAPTQKAQLAAVRQAEEAKAARLLFGDQAGIKDPILPDLHTPEIARLLRPDPRLRLDPGATQGVETNGVFVVPLQESSRILAGGIQVGASYSTAENFTANGGIVLTNLFRRNLFDWSDPFDSLDINGRAGPQVQGVDSRWGTSFLPRDSQLQVQVSANGSFEHNDRTAFPGPPAATFDTRVWTGGANAAIDFDSFSLKDKTEKLLDLPLRKRFEYLAAFSTGLKYEDTTIREPDTLPTPDQGRTTTLNGRVGVTLIFDRHEPKQAGIGEIEWDASLSGDAAPSALSDHFNYTKWQMATKISISFGWADSKDFLFSQNLRNGSIFGKVPALDLFRLGGDSVRGLQQGELAGRSVVSTSTELGYSLARLGQSVFGSSTNATLGSMLDGTYLKGFFDWGRTSQNGNIGSPWHEGDGAVAYGAALDIAKPSIGPPSRLTLGYALSPQSRLHRGGMVFVSADFPF